MADITSLQNVRKVAIIGGGVAGISAARVFLSKGLDVALFECTEQLGGVWAENYEGFGIQVPASLYEFPDEPLPKGSDFCSGKQINIYINAYAKKHGITKVAQMKTRVMKMEQNNGGYVLNVDKNGEVTTPKFDLVVVATGVYGKQYKIIPKWHGSENFQGKIIHSADYVDSGVSQDKDVITVGFGKSAFDCAAVSVKVAKSNTMLFREAHWCVPRKILGLVPFEFATFNRFGVSVLKPKYIKSGPFEKFVHCFPGFLTFFWWLVSVIFKTQFWLPRQCIPELSFMGDFWRGHGILPHPDFFSLIRQGKIDAKKGEIREIKERSVILMSGEELPCDVIVAATGYKTSHSFLLPEINRLKEKDGLWLYRQMIHPDYPNLVFVGSQVTTFTNITTPGIQARWLMELVEGRHELPTKTDMKAQISEMQEWKRKTMPNAEAARATMIQTHQVHYYDQLLKDMGVTIRRKNGNVFSASIKEIFDPYRPRDYKEVVTGNLDYGLAGDAQCNFFPEAFWLLSFVGIIVGISMAPIPAVQAFHAFTIGPSMMKAVAILLFLVLVFFLPGFSECCGKRQQSDDKLYAPLHVEA